MKFKILKVTLAKSCQNYGSTVNIQSEYTPLTLTPLRSCEGLPAVPEQGSGERMVFPDAAASSPLALNGNRVNPLKVHPSAAETRQSRAGEWREGTRGRRRKEKRQQQAVRRKSAAGQCCSLHAERAKQTVEFRLGFHCDLEH